MAGDDSFLQIHDMGHDFTLPDFDASLDPYAQFSSLGPLTPLDSHSPTRTKSRVSLACIPCRSRHTRCDATAPICAQCSASGRPCSYAQSRRGRGKLAALEQRQQPTRCEEVIDLERQYLNLQPRAASHETSSVSSATSCLGQGQSPASPLAFSGGRDTVPRSAPESDDLSKLINIYYASFHDAHPFVLPHRFLTQRLQTNSASLRHLLPVLRFIGSLFDPSAPKQVPRACAENALLPDDLPATGFTVQALLIFAIAVHSCNEFVYARRVLDRATRISLEINMQSKSFATTNGEGCAVLEESWRRTWWYLYVTDGIFAGVRHCLTFSLYEIDADVDLPCEEIDYQNGEIPQPRTLKEYHSREFAGEELNFSSFTYLIDLGHILGAVLALDIELRELFEPDVISADASLMNWSLYLPKRKQLVDEDLGTVDEILFQAHMLCNTLKIYLHRPRSQLSYNLIEHTSQCAPPPLSTPAATQQRAHAFHTAKALEAADAALALLTLPGSFTAHSPLVVCGLALAILAQLAACRLRLRGPRYAAARERVRLGLGKVAQLGSVWEVGRVTVGEVRGIAREVLELSGEEGKTETRSIEVT